ncbi:hypothetical protein Tco_1076978, partial [Tanacetum coccineum]
SHVFCIIRCLLHFRLYRFQARQSLLGADDEEITDGGIPRVILYGYDGLPMQPVAPPSSDYIPGLEDPQTPPVPQDEDKHEAMFIQPHDPDYVPEPIYPEYVTESDPEEDLEEYEDNETEDGLVDYPMDGGDDGDDNNGDSSRDDAGDEFEDEEDEEEEEEEHPLRSTPLLLYLLLSLILHLRETEPIMPPPSTDIYTTGARITIRL